MEELYGRYGYVEDNRSTGIMSVGIIKKRKKILILYYKGA